VVSQRLGTEIQDMCEADCTTNPAVGNQVVQGSTLDRSKRLVDPARLEEFVDSDQPIAPTPPEVGLGEVHMCQKIVEFASALLQIPNGPIVLREFGKYSIETHRVGPLVATKLVRKHQF
jgi:hypothetical protein